MSKPQSALEVAKQIIYRATRDPVKHVQKEGLVDPKSAKYPEFGSGVVHTKLQKLLYYAQARSLVYYDKELFADEIEAWQYGPVVPAVYEEYKNHKYEPILFEQEKDEIKLSKIEKEIVDTVWGLYGYFSAGHLVELTHSHDIWKLAYREGEGTVIPKEEIKRYHEPYDE